MSQSLFLSLTAMGLLLTGSAAHAQLLWSPEAASTSSHEMQAGRQPSEKGAVASPPANHSGHNSRRGTTLFLQDGHDATLWMITPTLESRPLELEDADGQLTIPKTGMENYHALVASRQKDALHESSLRYVYLQGKPTGRSPAELMANNKLPLEIVPDPMAREHARFLSQMKQSFMVRFQGHPVSDVWVEFISSHGTKLEAKTDAAGRVSVIIPDDFKSVIPGRKNNKPAEFTLSSSYAHEGILYRTNFSTPYSVNPSHWQSSNVGLFMLTFGFMSGLVAMRRAKPEINNRRKEGSA
ncbi:MAG: hypothetical protein HQL49_11810 [Gammaproteobacteria bacterium]|nr:hypothetical protein [Gammaproteobacteria bacterium]